MNNANLYFPKAGRKATAKQSAIAALFMDVMEGSDKQLNIIGANRDFVDDLVSKATEKRKLAKGGAR